MIFITGDCHGDWTKFSSENFPEQKTMTRDDYVIVCGDFGIWAKSKEEDYWLNWLEKKNFTLLFVDGNHENFDRLYSDEFPIVTFNGGKAHQIRPHIYHLMRGEVFTLQGMTFFAFGGAASHDVEDGILNLEDYPSHAAMIKDYHRKRQQNQCVRINHETWWKEELPSEEEMKHGLKTLQKYGNEVDFIVTHCAPNYVAERLILFGDDNALTQYFTDIAKTVKIRNWFMGHYHHNCQVMTKFVELYEQIIRIA